MRAFFLVVAFFIQASWATAQEREWTLNASDKEGFLVFGVPDTDDVGFSFWCQIGTNTVAVFLPGAPASLKSNQVIDVNVDIDGKPYKLKAKVARDKPAQLPSVEGKIPISDALISAAANANRIAITVQGKTKTFPLVDADVEGLRRICAGNEVN